MKNLLYITCLLGLLSSCSLDQDEKITWDLPKHSEMLVVESIITSELKQQAVHLTTSNPYLDSNAPKSVSGATVNVSDGTNSFNFLESTEMPGWYFSQQKFAGQSLKTYTLSIQLTSSINGLTVYTAQSQLPEGLVMDSMKCEIYKMPESDLDETDSNEEKDTTVLGIYYFGNEPKNAENFYFTKVFRNGKMLYTNPKEYMYFSLAYENETYTHIVGIDKNIAKDDIILYRLYTIGRDYYKYLEAVQSVDFSGNAFSMSGPPANVVGNVSDGKALGYFLAAYVSEKEAKAIDKR